MPVRYFRCTNNNCKKITKVWYNMENPLFDFTKEWIYCSQCKSKALGLTKEQIHNLHSSLLNKTRNQ